MSELTQYLRQLFESDRQLHDVAVTGEISNVSRPRSGHMYFSLQDGQAKIQCVMWRRDVARLIALPQDGDQVVVYGNVSLYSAGGRYQLYVSAMLTAGVGTLLVQLEEQKRKLAAEGLFDPGRKQPVPAYPECVVLVTSPTGAAYHDMIRVLTRRWPCARVELVETAVQGSSAPTEIVAALQAADRLQPDVILLGRGGGSMEDLWAFNSEAVVRAIVAVSVPLVSGIGHETDFTLADFAADLRAPTPSAAAEISTPDQREVRQSLDRKSRQLADILHHHLQSGHAAIRELDGCLRGLSPGANLQSARQRLHYLSQQILDAVLNSLLLRSRDMLVLDKALSSLGPETTLARGYAIVTRVETDEIVDRTCSLSVGEALNVCVGEGRFTAKVASIQSSR